MAYILSCNTALPRIEHLLNALENNSDILVRAVDAVVNQVDDYVINDLLDPNINQAINNINNKIYSSITDYTNRLNNTGDALSTFDQDFNEFKRIANECLKSRSLNFLRNLDLGVDLPDLSNIDAAFLGFSELTDKLSDLAEFPHRYLNSIRKDILNKASDIIMDLGNGAKDLLAASGLDNLEITIPDKITNIAKELDLLLNCAKKIACSSLNPYYSRYEIAMVPVPLYPPFELNTSSKLIPLPNYKLDSNSIYSTTIATQTQINNLNLAKTTFSKSMDHARNLSSLF